MSPAIKRRQRDESGLQIISEACRWDLSPGKVLQKFWIRSVSYTHLDVYKRQEIGYSKIAEDSSRRQTIVGVVKADRGRKAIVGRVRTDSSRRQNHGKRTL